VHLLTTEAFATYQRHLKPDGVIAVNISNRYLDLRPVVRHSAMSIGIKYAGWISTGDEAHINTMAFWTFATRNATFMQNFAELLERRRAEFPREPGDTGHWPANFGTPMDMSNVAEIKPWTDDYSNIFKIIKKD